MTSRRGFLAQIGRALLGAAALPVLAKLPETALGEGGVLMHGSAPLRDYSAQLSVPASLDAAGNLVSSLGVGHMARGPEGMPTVASAEPFPARVDLPPTD